MTDKEKLIELLKKADENADLKCITDYEDAVADIADYLLANGVIVPPCKVGDTVYLPIKTDWGTIENYEIVEVGQDRDGIYFRIYDEEQNKVYLEEIGKTVFLTKEEAEGKLKKG